jgi:hypothetical protein
MATLKAIEDANMIFISAQPDTEYFHWQVELYMYQFAKHGISDRCYAIFGYNGVKPSEYAVELSKRYNIYFYKADSTLSLKPYLLKQFFQEFPELGNCVFYHESDILLSYLPKFELLINDSYGHLSDITSTINYTYIHTCGNRYKAIHKSIADDDILTKMCELMQISEDLVRKNNSNSGGDQYLLKNVTSQYWESVEISTNKLYNLLKQYQMQYPIINHIDESNVDKWAILWEYWKLGKETRVTFESDMFLSVKTYKCANLFQEYVLNRNIFDKLIPNSPTYIYANILKEYVDSGEYIYTKSFVLLTKEIFGGLYKEDILTVYFNKAVWRSMSKTHLIFYNSNAWILIESSKEYEISKDLEGLAINSGIHPYFNEWNIDCKILKG